MIEVKRTERGWVAHFICANRCRFRRNTLLECGSVKIVVSSVGLMEDYRDEEKFSDVGRGRYYETMAFHSDPADTRYHDIDVSRQISFESPRAIYEVDADDRANLMHETVVGEIAHRLANGDTFND